MLLSMFCSSMFCSSVLFLCVCSSVFCSSVFAPLRLFLGVLSFSFVPLCFILFFLFLCFVLLWLFLFPCSLHSCSFYTYSSMPVFSKNSRHEISRHFSFKGHGSKKIVFDVTRLCYMSPLYELSTFCVLNKTRSIASRKKITNFPKLLIKSKIFG